jgi:quercetin dioxygenase-like cupin family protein
MAKRRDLLMCMPMALFASAEAKLPNTVVDAKAAKLSREPFGDLRVFYDGPTDQLKSMTAGSLSLKPGMSPHPPHQHPEEEIMIVTEGTGEIVVEGKKTIVGPGSMMYCAANHVHGVQNTGKTPLLFYYYKWRA